MIQLSLPAQEGPDKRRHARVDREFGVRYRSIRSEEWKTSKSGNISVGGLFVMGAEPPRVGTQIAFELTLNDQVFMKGTGTVRSHRAGDPKGFGVQFDAMDEATHKRVLGIVESYVTGMMMKVDRPMAPPTRKKKKRGIQWSMWIPAGIMVVAAIALGWWLIHLH